MLIQRDQLPLVNYQGMNQVHHRELDILNELYEAIVSGKQEEEISRLFNEFLEDVKEHFAYEEDLMKKTYFFAYECHSGEHRRVLEELENVRETWEKTKNVNFLRNYFENTFKPWIVEHILTMDTVTGEYLSKVLMGAGALIFQS